MNLQFSEKASEARSEVVVDKELPGLVPYVWILQSNKIRIKKAIRVERANKSAFAYHRVFLVVARSKNGNHIPGGCMCMCHICVNTFSLFASACVCVRGTEVFIHTTDNVVSTAYV